MENYSVLMTVYQKDNAQFLELSINSILKQTYATDDFVIVCDGILSEELNYVLNRYKDIEILNIIRLETNVGLGVALQKGLPLCKNNLIARMDDDDISLLDRCEKEVVFLENNKDIAVVGGHVCEFIDNTDKVIRIKKVPLGEKSIRKFARRRNPFCHSSVMFRKDKVLEAGNYSCLRTNQDVELWVRMLNMGYKCENIDEILVNFRFNENTYKRRKDFKNIILMIKLWSHFTRKRYCSIIDWLYVFFLQIFILLVPEPMLNWCYDKLR